jgi:formamidopyrimidine-DNA glycosylase
MIEIPEAAVYANQLNETVIGRRVVHSEAAYSPHKFAWYCGDPAEYSGMLEGKTIDESYPLNGTLELRIGDVYLALSEGANMTFLPKGSKVPQKHQLLMELEDGSALVVAVQMYGGIMCFREGENENPYYLVVREKPSPLTDDFSREYFDSIMASPGVQRLSAKAALATGQRFPGLGNGVLQDILYHARIHPKRPLYTLIEIDKEAIFSSIKHTLQLMADQGGRDTEKDLFGNPGGYATCCSKNTVCQPCQKCGTLIEKASYLGGSIYFCPGCQKL